MQDPGGRSVARISRQKALAVVCLYGVASQQGPPLKVGNIVGTSIIRLIGAVLLEQNDVYGPPRVCKDNYAVTETGLAVVYSALSCGYTAAGPDGIRGSAAG